MQKKIRQKKKKKNLVDNPGLDAQATTTNKWQNKIVYELMSNQDCHAFSGLTKEEIIHHVEMCQLLPSDVFFIRVRFYRCLTYKLQETMFGQSQSYLRSNFKDRLPIYEKKYAKRYLINVLKQHRNNPYWTRETLKKHSPEFVKRL